MIFLNGSFESDLDSPVMNFWTILLIFFHDDVQDVNYNWLIILKAPVAGEIWWVFLNSWNCYCIVHDYRDVVVFDGISQKFQVAVN